MVATQLLISLCAVGVARAAPQAVSQEGIVTNVVTALQPDIAAAVAAALRGLTTSSTASANSGSGGGRFTVAGAGSANGFGSAGFSGQSAAAAAAAPAVKAPAKYNFQYQIADQQEQTYITQNEARDGTEVTGAYSYVDPNGDLVTVNYNAGLNGYSETRERQVGAVEIRAKPSRTTTTSAAVTSSQQQRQPQRPTVFRPQVVAQRPVTSGVNQQADLIAQILAALQPQITSAVNSAVANI